MRLTYVQNTSAFANDMTALLIKEIDRKMTSGSPSTGFSSGLSKYEDEQCVIYLLNTLFCAIATALQ